MIEEQVTAITTTAEPYRAPVAMPAPVADFELPEAAVPISQYLWIIQRQRWKILAAIVTAVLAALVISVRLTPVYESTATVDVDRRMPTGILGQEAAQLLNNDADQFLATQIKLIQSDSVLRPVVNRYKLREREKDAVEAPKDGKPADIEEAPVVLKKLKVTRPPNTYLLLISYRSPDRHLAAEVSNSIAQSYLEHTYNIRYKAAAGLSQFMERQLEELKAKMEQSSAALAQFERELSVINPEEKINILSNRLVQLNTEYTNAQAERLKKEAAYNSVKIGTLEAALVSTQGEALKKLTENLAEAQRHFAELKTHYGANHPEYRKAQAQVDETARLLDETRKSIGERVEIEYRQAQDREAMLQKAVLETKAESDRLNARSFDYQTLKRDAETDKKLYEELVRKIKEATINASFQNSAIRIADPARPGIKPVFPDLKLNLALAFLFSTLLSVGAAVIADMLNNTVRDPEQVARTLRAEVVGSLPLVKDWKRALLSMPVENAERIALRNGSEQTLTAFDEAIRTLRNSILLSDFDRRLRSFIVTSAAPSEGKSTVAANLAAAHAQQGRKTLLIDADLRRPSQHRRFNLRTSEGLSSVLVNDVPWRDAIHEGAAPNLDVLLAGPASRRAADLVGSRLSDILEHAAEYYDLIIIDSPPLLGFPEPLQMAAAADGVLVVALAGQTHRKALSSVITTLARLRANVIGVVLNSMRADISNGYYYHYYHSKYYHRYQIGNSPD